MLNEQHKEPLTSAELFLLMRLLQHLENQGQLPEEPDCNWQNIYSKLNYSCLEARRNRPVLEAIQTTTHP